MYVWYKVWYIVVKLHQNYFLVLRGLRTAQELFYKIHYLHETFTSHGYDISSWCEICGKTQLLCISIKIELVNSSSVPMSAIFIQNLCLQNIFINFVAFFFTLNLRTVDCKLPYVRAGVNLYFSWRNFN